ncbi:uncharacterized protein LOC110759673 [Prunus avium]|uniref:Uncharacterized protein LOC110759673 n=1 Tax=Prunus avium TaxID=42229 RepID=A0A6P5SKI6_PRUAV|nr:uncharacterized protein LOC110759673 [Prunus avium]
MATEEQGEEKQQTTSTQAAAGLGGAVVEKYRQIKEHAETYPYVWGSYIAVYGGLALWTAYRWRKLRKTEDRVRALQDRLRKHYAAEEASAIPPTPVRKVPVPPPADKISK